MCRLSQHQSQDLIQLFDSTFYGDFNTRLVKGDDEPLYAPAHDACSFHQIIFAHGYFASALHEISHWCIAGEKRRLLEDFGYWYQPDGRNKAQQKTFEQVEIKPQAIEWAFSVAANKRFSVSADNLNGEQSDSTDFKKSVHQQVIRYIHEGFPKRAEQFIQVLCQFYRSPYPLTVAQFTLGNDHV